MRIGSENLADYIPKSLTICSFGLSNCTVLSNIFILGFIMMSHCAEQSKNEGKRCWIHCDKNIQENGPTSANYKELGEKFISAFMARYFKVKTIFQ